MGKRPPYSEERLREIYNSAVLTTNPALTGRSWTTAVTERAYSILTTEDEIIDKLHSLDACYSDNPTGKAYYGVIVAVYIDPNIAYRGFVRFLAPNPEDRTGSWLEEEVRTAPLRGNPDGQHLYQKAVKLIGHRVLIAKNKDANAPKTRAPWVLTHLEDGGYDTTKPNWGAEWNQATTNDLNPVPSNAHIIPGGNPSNGFNTPITDPVALDLHACEITSSEASAPSSHTTAHKTSVKESPVEVQQVDTRKEPHHAGQQQLKVPTEPDTVSVPPNQAFLHQGNTPAPERAPTEYTSNEAKNAIISGAKELGLGEEEAIRAAKAAWNNALAAPTCETVSVKQVQQAVTWISEHMKSQSSHP